ncbi:MAG: SDR family NAD(P)-dependent oxidoreductase [Balneolaceae bacterium]
MKTALITGASSGIGKALAHEFAQNEYDLVVVAEKEDELSQAAKELKSKYQVQVFEVPVDLTKEEAPQQIYDQVKTEGLLE